MENSYPMRINKYLAYKKISTRREADNLIKEGKVFINGKPAVLGNKVNENDVVRVEEGKNRKSYVYFAYNKPKGIITHSPQEKEIDIKESIKNAKIPDGIFPVGRLDKNSHGLIILTNDGRITDRLLNPKYPHEKEYVVKTLDNLRLSFKKKMESGVNIEGYITKKCEVVIIDKKTFRIILTEGKKHQIKRMCSALFQEVIDLKRERIINIELGKLKPGSLREIKGKKLSIFLKEVLG